MKKWLTEKLRCPECLTDEIPLSMNIQEELNDDVIKGDLKCCKCRRVYPIEKGIANLLPTKSIKALASDGAYNTSNMLSSYLWSHYSEFFDDPYSSDAYQKWSSFFSKSNGLALDIGCAVGRLSFEMSKTHSHVIGIDTSLSFIEKARELLKTRELNFNLIIEGHITEARSCALDPDWNYDQVEFIIADALALPFPKNFFSTVSSVNIIEKVSKPIKHLMDIDRIIQKQNAKFVFSDPFSWDENFSDKKDWLSGLEEGKFQGRGIDNISRILSGQDGIMDPPFDIAEKGSIPWKIRKTENLWEYINSQYIIATRNNKK